MELLVAACVLPALLPSPVLAEKATAAFLKIPVDARAVGLGAGIVAVAEGAAAMAQNPAGLGLAPSQELFVLYAPQPFGTELGHLGYGHPTRLGVFGLSYLNFRSGRINGRDEQGRPTGQFSAEDRATGVSWSRPLGLKVPLAGQMAAGAHFKHISSRIGSYEASSYAFDLGLQSGRRLGSWPAQFGLAIRNLGPGLAYQERTDPLPLNIGYGVAFQPLGPVTISLGGTRYLAGERDEFSIGTELSPFSRLTLRGNYGMIRSGDGQASAAALPLLSWGFGLRLARYQFDYAFMPLGELGSTQRLSLTMRFGALGRAKLGGALRLVDETPWASPLKRDRVRLISQALREGRIAVAAAQLERAYDAEPGNAALFGMLQRAREVRAEFPVIAEEGWGVLARRGAAAFVEGHNLREAVLWFRQAYEEDPENDRLLAVLNRVERQAGVPEPSRRLAQGSAAGFIEERLLGARNAAYDGHYELAVRRTTEVLEIRPDHVRALEIKGSAHFLMGARGEARAAWQRVIEIEPGNSQVAEYLAKVQ